MPTKKLLAITAFAISTALVFAAGWLAHQIYTNANPPSFEILENYQDEISLIRFEKLNSNILEGSYEGKQPRFLLGENEELFVPSEKFQLDLEKL